jgi:ABC-type multidrug transport system fused ATPase/permease subunit
MAEVTGTRPRQDLDARSSGLDTHTDINWRESLAIIWRAATYIKLFWGRYLLKFAFKLAGYMVPLAFLPWPMKILTDHVILGKPMSEATGYPDYMLWLVNALSGQTPFEILMWLVLIGFTMVVVMGRYAQGYEDDVTIRLAQGMDYATRSDQSMYAEGQGSAVGGLWGYIDFRIATRLVQALNHTVRAQIFNRISSLSITQLEDQRIGDSMYRTMYDSTQITEIFWEVTHTPVMSTVLFVQAVWQVQNAYPGSPAIMWITAAAFPTWLLFTSIFARLVRRKGQAARAAGALTTSTVEEGMDNMMAVQSLGSSTESGRFHGDSKESFKRFLVVGGIWQIISRSGEILSTIVYGAVFAYVGYQVIDGNMTPGDFLAISLMIGYLRGPAMSLATLWIRLQDNVAGMRRVFAMLDLEPESDLGSATLPPIEKGVTMRGAGFVYPDGRRALRDIDLEANIGQIVAIVGPTGCGKTSLAYLIPRFNVATEGEIRIDGYNVNDVTMESLRSQITYVFQETQLFSDSILDNIRYGKPDADRAEVERVARVAGVHDFISSLPEGYDTKLGTASGSKLSVGQKQRIALARGLLRDSRVLILDEPTSALDPETEQYLVQSLHEAAKDRLVIIIAHRLSTIAQADKIVFLEGGSVVEQGTHSELVANQDGHYRRFVDLQTQAST